MDTYDPMEAPDADAWLALDETDRFDLVLCAHEDERDTMEGFGSHCAMHVIVENQLAEAAPQATREALHRLQEEGLDRHEAVHAIGSIVATLMFDMMQGGTDPLAANEALAEQLAGLTRNTWNANG